MIIIIIIIIIIDIIVVIVIVVVVVVVVVVIITIIIIIIIQEFPFQCLQLSSWNSSKACVINIFVFHLQLFIGSNVLRDMVSMSSLKLFSSISCCFCFSCSWNKNVVKILSRI